MVAPIVVTPVVTAVLPPVISALIGTVRVMLAIVLNVDVAIPGVANEEHRSITRAIFVAVAAPVAFAPRRNPKVDRRRHRALTRPLDDDGIGVDELWRRGATDIDLTEEARIAEVQGHAEIGGSSASRQAGEQRRDEQGLPEQRLHAESPARITRTG